MTDCFFVPVSCEFPQLFIRTLYVDPTANAKANGSSTVLMLFKHNTPFHLLPQTLYWLVLIMSLYKRPWQTFINMSPAQPGRIRPGIYVMGQLKSLPPSGLCRSDHNCVCLLTTYRTCAEAGKAQTKDVKVWMNKSELSLQEPLDCSRWDVSKQSRFVTFCRDMTATSKRVKSTQW